MSITLACGPKAEAEAEGETGETSSSGDGDGDSGDGDGGPGDGDGEPGDGDGDADICDGFDDAHGPGIEVTIENASAQTMYVGLVDACAMRVLTWASTSGEPTPGLANCWTCAGALAASCECPGPPCFLSAGLKLEPGASYVTGFGATRYVSRELPEACVDPNACPTACQQAEPWPDGDYDISITVSDQVACDGGGCDCDASGEGWCFIEVDGSLAGTPSTLSALFTRPDDAPVTITIE